MALIKCSECGREVSDKATTCPHCGCPILSKSGYTVTYTIQSMGIAGAMHNNSVSGIIQSVTNEIQKKGGRIIDIKNGPIQYIPLMTTQTIVFIYEAPQKIYQKSNCTVTVQKKTFGLTPEARFVWRD